MGRNTNKQTLSVGFGLDFVGHTGRKKKNTCKYLCTHIHTRTHSITCTLPNIVCEVMGLTEAEMFMNVQGLCIPIVLFVKNWQIGKPEGIPRKPPAV